MGAACSKQDTTVDGNNPHHNYYQQQNQLAQQNGGVQTSTGPWYGCMSSCSAMDPSVDSRMDSCRADAIDPVMYDLCRKSLNMTLADEENKVKEEAAPPQPATGTQPKQKQRQPPHYIGQYHLLYKHQPKSPNSSAQETPEDTPIEDISTVPTASPYSTRLIVRRRPIAAAEEGTHGTHLYAIRYPPDDVVETRKVMSGSNSDTTRLQEQCPTPSMRKEKKKRSSGNDPAAEPIPEPPRPSPAPPQTALPTEGLTDFFQPARMKQTKASKQTSKCCVS